MRAKAESASKRQLKKNETRLQKISGKKHWKALNRPRNAIQTKVDLLQNVVSRDVQNPRLSFCEEKLPLTAKLDNRSYVKNNRNRKVSSKLCKL